MAIYSNISALSNGVLRNIDLTANTLKAQAFATASYTLSDTILGRLISVQDGTAKAGSTYVTLDKSVFTNFTPAADTLASALTAIDSAIGGKVSTSVTVNGHALTGNVTVTKSDVSLGNVDNVQQLPMSYLDTDITLAADSDAKVPSQKAIKSYVDTHTAAALDGTFTISNTATPSKKIAFSAAGITASTTRTITMPDANVDLGNLTNSNISASAAIAYSKLSLSASIVNADINASAAIAYSKLSLSNSIVNADINASAAIAYSKLSLSASIVNADIATGAAIAYSKLALSASIVNADIASGAAIVESKLSLDYSTSSLNTAIGGKVAKAGDTMTGTLSMGANKVTSSFVPNANDVLVNKLYVDGLVAGAVWQDPVIDVNLIDATIASGAFSGSNSDTYIAAATAGGWTAGHAYQWDGVSAWVDLLGRAVAIGDRFGISMESATAASDTNPAGTSLTGNDDRILTVTGATPGAMTFSFYTPTFNHAVYVSNAVSAHAGHQYNYNGSAWVEFGGLVAVNAGIGLELVSNVLNIKMGAGVAQLPSDEVGVDVHADGGLFTTVDNAASSTATAAQLAIKLDGSTLAKGASGLKVATGGIANNEINASAAIAYSKLNLGTSIVNADISGSAAIAYSKLNLGTSIVNADISASAAIVYSKLSLSASIVNADIASGAAIAYSKLALSASIVNADIASGAAIAYSKLSLALSIATGDLVAASVTKAKIATDVFDQITITGGAGTAASVASAPAIASGNEVAGESFSATTLYAVRYGQNAETAGRIYKADEDASSTDNFFAVGLMTTVGALSAADPAPAVYKFGLMSAPSHGLTVGKPFYVGVAGALTSTAPTTAGHAVVRLGMVKSSSVLDINIQVVAVV